MSIVVGTAGHIDHGKTTLLRALTGIDADRLPEERRRGMTIDVGYAHLALPSGAIVDFVDVPGHDRLVGNMLVGAGEIDAVMLVVAADDGPSAQTLEHLELLDAIGIRDGIVAITKADVVPAERAAAVADDARGLVARTTLAGSPVVVVSGVTRAGLPELVGALEVLAGRVSARSGETGTGGARLAVDRAFTVKGRGTVVTGSLRGGPVRAGASLRLVPGGAAVRVREVQARGSRVDAVDAGRAALLLAGTDGLPARGSVLTADARVVSTSRLLVALRAPAGLGSAARRGIPVDRARLRLHAGTARAGGFVVRGPRESIDLPGGAALAILRLDAEIAAAIGDPFALRDPSPAATAAGGVVLDPWPPRGVSRRRLTPERAIALADAVAAGDAAAADAARLDLHGAVLHGPRWRLADDVAAALRGVAIGLVTDHHEADAASAGLPMADARAELALAARRRVTLGREAADHVARDIIAALVDGGALARDGDRLRNPARRPGLPPETVAAMDRLEAALSVAAPPPLAAAAQAAGCGVDGVRALETTGRIVRLEDDLAWSASTYRELVKRALAMAAVGPLTPAAFRDATGSSRRYVMVVLEDLDRRGLLRRTDAGHVLGPRAVARMRAGPVPVPDADPKADA